MLMNARRAQALGALALFSACAVGLGFGQGGSSLMREATAAPSVPPPPPGGGGTMPSTYVAPTTGIIDTTVRSAAKVSYEVVSDSPDLFTANVNYTEDGKITGFAPVALPWTRPVSVTPPMSIVTVYATLPSNGAVDPDSGEAQTVPSDASISCRVLVNGVVVKEDVARGPKSTATCSVSVNIDDTLPVAPASSGAPVPSAAPGAPIPTAPTAPVPTAPAAPVAPGEPQVTTLRPPPAAPAPPG